MENCYFKAFSQAGSLSPRGSWPHDDVEAVLAGRYFRNRGDAAGDHIPVIVDDLAKEPAVVDHDRKDVIAGDEAHATDVAEHKGKCLQKELAGQRPAHAVDDRGARRRTSATSAVLPPQRFARIAAISAGVSLATFSAQYATFS